MKNHKNILRLLVLIAVTLMALYLCWLMLQPFVNVLAWAVVLAILFFPAHERILARVTRPSLAALLSCALATLTIVVPLALVLLAVVNEAAGAAQSLQSTLQDLLDPNSPASNSVLHWLNQYVDISRARIDEFFIGRLRGMSGAIIQNTIGFVGDAASLIVQFFFVIFTMYYLFRDGEKIHRALFDALPLRPRQAHTVFTRTHDVIYASVYGVLMIAAIQGALGGLAFWVCRRRFCGAS